MPTTAQAPAETAPEENKPAQEGAEAPQEAAPADGEPPAADADAAGVEESREEAAPEVSGAGEPPQEQELVGGVEQERLTSAVAAGPIEPEPELTPLEACVHVALTICIGAYLGDRMSALSSVSASAPCPDREVDDCPRLQDRRVPGQVPRVVLHVWLRPRAPPPASDRHFARARVSRHHRSDERNSAAAATARPARALLARAAMTLSGARLARPRCRPRAASRSPRWS